MSKLEIHIDTDKICPRCGAKGTTQNGLCLKCCADLVKGQPLLRPKTKTDAPGAQTEIRKIKVKDGRIYIKWDVRVGGAEEVDSYILDCKQEAKESFYAALSALAPHVATICELLDAGSAVITVSGVSFSWTDGVMGATITGLKTLRTSSAPLVLNTPHKPESPYGEGDDSNLLPEDTVTALYELMAEAEAYIRGERKYEQMELFQEKGSAA